MEVKEGVAEEPRAEEAAGAEPKAERSRRPYQKPAFRSEQIFETMALACGKIAPTQGHCRFNRKSS